MHQFPHTNPCTMFSFLRFWTLSLWRARRAAVRLQSERPRPLSRKCRHVPVRPGLHTAWQWIADLYDWGKANMGPSAPFLHRYLFKFSTSMACLRTVTVVWDVLSLAEVRMVSNIYVNTQNLAVAISTMFLWFWIHLHANSALFRCRSLMFFWIINV